jgi:hypothetical protein
MPIPCNEEDRRFFTENTMITMGNGTTTSFWQSAWLLGESPKHNALTIYKLSKQKRRSVHDALADDGWIRDIDVLKINSVIHPAEFTQLWVNLRGVHLDPQQPDSIVWNGTKHGEYTMASSYAAHFKGLQIFLWNA